MSQFNSQEQTIYRSLAGQIQLGFFQDGQRFPSAQEIASRYQVSYCPAQRALKALERDGLIRLCRGKETVVLRKPYENYLDSDVFQQRIAGLIDLVQTLKLISAPICFQGLCNMSSHSLAEWMTVRTTHPGKCLYRLFDQSIQALGSRTALSLYYDIGAFAESAFLDLLYAVDGDREAGLFMGQLIDLLLNSLEDCRERRYGSGKDRLAGMGHRFFDSLEGHLRQRQLARGGIRQESFFWEPYKGRVRYCEFIAIDILYKIQSGIYPIAGLLPHGAVMSDIYLVSQSTIRRTIGILNKSGITKSKNGVGTYVVSGGDETFPYRIKQVMKDDKIRMFLEAFQLLAITCEDVIPLTFPQCPPEALSAILNALQEEHHTAVIMSVSACLQAIVRHCPLKALREIYEKLTLLLLNGSVLQFIMTGKEPLHAWPDLSVAMSESLMRGDYPGFAVSFHRLIAEDFIIMKDKLLEIGIAGVEQVSNPIVLNSQR